MLSVVKIESYPRMRSRLYRLRTVWPQFKSSVPHITQTPFAFRKFLGKTGYVIQVCCRLKLDVDCSFTYRRTGQVSSFGHTVAIPQMSFRCGASWCFGVAV